MMAKNETALSGRGGVVLGEVQENWGWLLALGLLFIILGVIGLGRTFALTVASAMFFGILLLIGGAFNSLNRSNAEAGRASFCTSLLPYCISWLA